MQRIGFIGLGLMGASMVSRLLDKEYAVNVLGNSNRSGLDAAVARGAVERANAREIAENSDVVMLCMGTSAQVEARMRGDDGVIAGLQADQVVIDFGTSLPQSTRALAAEVSAAGGAYLDAPLGRTPTHALTGQLNIMGAGDEAAYQRVLPVLQDLGENVFHLGASGAGHTIKLLNNYLGMTTANAVAEIFAVADRADVPRQAVFDVMSSGPLHSMMMDFVKSYAIDGDPSKLAFAVKNAAKDVGYYQDMVQALGVESAIAPGVASAMNNAVAEGRGDHMVSQMVDYYATRTD